MSDAEAAFNPDCRAASAWSKDLAVRPYCSIRDETMKGTAKYFVWICLSAFGCAQQLPSSHVPSVINHDAHSQFGKFPVSFEANQGQMDSAVQFAFKGPRYSTFLTSDGMVLYLRSPQNTNPAKTTPAYTPSISEPPFTIAKTQPSAPILQVQIQLVGSLPHPQVVGELPRSGKVNYFIGNDPHKWHTNIPTFGQVRYKNVYPGVDLVYHGQGSNLEYDFAISPGADPANIQMEVKGVDTLSLDGRGNLLLAKGQSEISFQTPGMYQENEGKRTPITGEYVIKDSAHIGFRVHGYDPNKSLVIDPVLLYASYLGGSDDDQATSIAVDNSSDTYVSGYSYSLDFPLATYSGLAPGWAHAFVAKLDPTGSNLIYVDFIGGDCNDLSLGMAVDSSNSAYVAGYTCSDNFPLQNPYQTQFKVIDAFLTKISPDGASLIYSTYLGGSKPTFAFAVAVDTNDQPYVAGLTYSYDFPLQNAYQSSVSPNAGNVSGYYGFLTKFTPTGSSLIFSTYFAGSSNTLQPCGLNPCWPAPVSQVTGIALDLSGNAYVAGETNTYDFPTTSGAYQTSNPTLYNKPVGFVAEFGATGNLDYSSYFIGSLVSGSSLTGIAVDNAGSAYITGSAQSDGTFPITTTAICDPSIYNLACGSGFVTKLDPTGSTLAYSTFLSPYNAALPTAIALDAQQDAYVWGTSYGGQMSLINGIQNYGGQNDGMVVEIDPQAGSETLATYLGGTGYENSGGMALDSEGNIYLSGYTTSEDFPTTETAFQTGASGGLDSFVAKIGPASAPSVSLSPFSLQYGTQAIGTTSQPSNVVMRNMGSSPLTISGISNPTDFSVTNTCGTNLPAAGTCTFSIAFSPTIFGQLNEAIVIQDDAAGSPHTINLAGHGAAASAQLNPASLDFGNLALGQSSSAQAITLTNSGNISLNLTNIQIGAGFSQTNNCPAQLLPASSCQFKVIFTPSTPGTNSASLILSDSAPDSPQSVSLTGVGIGVGALIPSSPSLSFGNVTVGAASQSQTLTFANTGTESVSISSIHTTGDFAQSSSCKTIAPNGTCAISLVFSPISGGTRQGTITLADSATNSPQVVSLTGTGVDFSISTATPSETVKAGSPALYALTIAPVGGTFPSPIQLACGSLPASAVCAISPGSISLSASSASVAVAITTASSVRSSSINKMTPNLLARSLFLTQGVALLGALVVIRKKREKRISSLLLALVFAASLGFSGCAIGSSSSKTVSQTGTPTPSGTYTVSITATAGSLQHSVPIVLVVQ